MADIRKFFPAGAAASGSKAPRSPAKTSIGREKSASFTPTNKRPQKTNAPKGPVMLLSSDESDGESPLTQEVKKEIQKQQRRRAVIDSDDDDIPTLVSQMPAAQESSSDAGPSKGVKRKPVDAAAPDPKRSKKATIQLDSDSEVEVPDDDSEEEKVAEKKKGRRRRTPPGMQKLDAFTMKGYKDRNAPKFAAKKTVEKHVQMVDPIEFINNFGHPSSSAARAPKKTPQKKSPAKASGVSPTEEKENKAKKAASKVGAADVDQQDDAASERSPARRTSPRKGATVERRSAEATPSKKKKTMPTESMDASVVAETPQLKNKSPSKVPKDDSDISILEETPEPKAKAPVKVTEKPKPSKGAAKSPSKTSSADKAASKSSFAPERVQTSKVAPAKITPPQPKEPPTLPWVDKYKPSKPMELVGQLTEKSPYNKLLSWLRNWHKHNLGEAAHEKKVKPAPFAKNDDGRAFKAALLSGPPGIGKTTSAVMACKELGLTYTELNASDARNKKKMDQMVGESLESRGLDMWMMQKRSEPTEVNHVLIMDEVDGMSGNQDRAGLILMMKRSKIPIICICNDRQSQKIRSLANHCFDLRFNRPQVAQIKGRLMTIITREGLKVPKELVDKIIEASNQDIRQCIYSLQLVAAGLSNEKELQQKDVSVNIFEAARRLLSSETNLMEKQEMFFTDYSIMPLFVQENYPNVRSKRMSSLEHVRALSKAADSLVLGDMIDKQIRTAGSWNLLSDQAMMSCAIPCLYLDGHLTEQLQFPSWLGRNATSGKRQRLMRQLASHTHLKQASISGSSHALVTDYIPVLRDRMYRPLANRENDGVPEVVALYNEYDLLRDDTEAIDELGVWPQFPDIAKSINSKTKAALTRTLNKESRLLPYALEEPIKGRRKAAAAGGGELELDEEGHVVEKVIGVDDDEAVADEEDEPSSGGGVVVKKAAGAGGKPSKATGVTRGKGRGGRGGK